MGEPRHEAGAVDALDRYWEHVLGGSADGPGAAAPDDTDPDLAATVRRVHALPDAPGPEAAFVARLEEQLMASLAREHAVAGSTGAAGAESAVAPDRWRMDSTSAPKPTRRGGGWWWRGLNGVAAAGLALVMIAGLAVGWGQLPGRGGRPTRIPAIAEATPGAAVVDGTAMYLGNAARTGEVAGPGPATKPERSRQAGIARGEMGWSWLHAAPLVVDGLAYVAEMSMAEDGAGSSSTGPGLVMALDTATGAERWRTTVLEPGPGEDEGDGGFFVGAEAVADGTVYVGTTVYASPAPAEGARVPRETDAEDIIAEVWSSTSELAALDAATGVERWRVAVGAGASQPAVVDGVVYLGSGGDVLALDAATGAERWRTTVATAARAADGEIWVNAVAVGGGQVFAADGVGVLHALDARTGVERWRFASPDVTYLEIPVVAEGLVYLSASLYEDDRETVSGRMIALDAATGAERWVYQGDGYMGGPVVVGGGLAIVSDDRGGDRRLVALDAATGAERWSFETGGYVDAVPVLSGGVLYVSIFDPGVFNSLGPISDALGLGDSKAIRALDAATGERLWEVETGVDTNGMVVAEGKIYQIAGLADAGGGTLVAYEAR